MNLNDLINEKYAIEKKIEDELSKLPNYGSECHCGSEESIDFIHHGDFDEIHDFCLDCGGYKALL